MRNRAVALLAVTLLASAPARSQETRMGTALEALDLAKQLADFGHQHPDQPLALLTAAQLVLDNTPRPLAAASNGSSAGAKPAFDVPRMLRDAQAAAGNDRNLRALIARLQSLAGDGSRGALSGPRGASYSVAASQSNDLPVAFAPRAHAEVRVVGSPGSNVECTVRASDGSTLSSDRGSSRCMLNFTPTSADPVHIIVHNMTGGALSYLVLTN